MESGNTETLSPEAAALLNDIRAQGFAGWSLMTVQQVREMMMGLNALAGESDFAGTVEETRVSAEVTALIYRVPSALPPPLILYFHPGGYVAGEAKGIDGCMRRLAHATGAARFVIEQPEWIEKKLVNFHATLTVPRGRFHPAFKDVPEFDTFAKADVDRRLLNMFRAFQYPRWPYIFPPGTPKEPVQIIREAMRKAFADPEFPSYFKKLMGDDPNPLGGEELEQTIKELPRDQEVVQLYKKLAGPDPLPSH